MKQRVCSQEFFDNKKTGKANLRALSIVDLSQCEMQNVSGGFSLLGAGCGNAAARSGMSLIIMFAYLAYSSRKYDIIEQSGFVLALLAASGYTDFIV